MSEDQSVILPEQFELESDVERKKALLAFLRSDDVVWKDEDHPELQQGSAEWVNRLRREGERF